MTSHHKDICEVHEVVLSQCRCGSADKVIRRKPCPGASCPGQKADAELADPVAAAFVRSWNYITFMIDGCMPPQGADTSAQMWLRGFAIGRWGIDWDAKEPIASRLRERTRIDQPSDEPIPPRGYWRDVLKAVRREGRE